MIDARHAERIARALERIADALERYNRAALYSDPDQFGRERTVDGQLRERVVTEVSVDGHVSTEAT